MMAGRVLKFFHYPYRTLRFIHGEGHEEHEDGQCGAWESAGGRTSSVVRKL